MVKAGMSPMDALKASTSVAARVLGIQHEVGRWAPGYMADILLVKVIPWKISRCHCLHRCVAGAAPLSAIQANLLAPILTLSQFKLSRCRRTDPRVQYGHGIEVEGNI